MCMSISIMAEKLLKASEAVRFVIPGVCLVLPVLKLVPAVGTYKALGVELVPHGRDDPALDQMGADTALVLCRGII